MTGVQTCALPISNLGQDFSAIAIYSGSWNIFNNTLYNIKASSGMIWLSGSIASPRATIANNIFVSNGSSPYATWFDGAVASQASLANNLYFGKGNGPAEDGAAINANPLFMSPSGLDFRLQSASPAINKGAASVGSVVTTDRDGVQRPQQGAFDIGAFEYVN